MRNSTEELKTKALEIFQAALKAVDHAEAILRHVRLEGEILWAEQIPFRLSEARRISIVRAGKASAPMAVALEGILQDRIHDGLVSVKYGVSLFL